MMPLDALERRMFFEAFNRRYQELRDSESWSEIEQERQAEEGSPEDRSE